MKTIIQLLFLLFLSIQVGFGQASQSIVRSVPLQAATTININIPGEVKGQIWDKDFVRIVITVNILNSGEDILKRLVTLGRYDIEHNEENDRLIIDMPKLAQQVVLKGINLEERFRVEVFYPKDIELEWNRSEAAL